MHFTTEEPFACLQSWAMHGSIWHKLYYLMLMIKYQIASNVFSCELNSMLRYPCYRYEFQSSAVQGLVTQILYMTVRRDKYTCVCLCVCVRTQFRCVTLELVKTVVSEY